MSQTTILYGIANCDTVKKARKWLQSHEIAHEFHDYKKSGIDKANLTRWSKELGWENLLNKRGTTWRKFSDDDKSNLTQTRAIELMLENTSVIKRPVVSINGKLLLGFDESAWANTFGTETSKSQ